MPSRRPGCSTLSSIARRTPPASPSGPAELSNGDLALTDEANALLTSAEFTAKYGSPDDTTFVTQIYENALGRAPDATGLGNWLGQLAGGTGRYQVVVDISESPEAVARLAGVISQPSLLVTA